MPRIHKDLLPIKAHYFFFFAALGPLLPQMNVFGRQLGISPAVMGVVTAVLPILWAIAKPTVGFLVDYFQGQRKLIFMSLIAVMSGSYCSLYFLPEPPLSGPPPIHDFLWRDIVDSQQQWVNVLPISGYCSEKDPSCSDRIDNNLIPASCGWICNNNKMEDPLSIRRQNYSQISNWTVHLQIESEDYRLINIFYDRNFIIEGCNSLNMKNYGANFDTKTNLDISNNVTISNIEKKDNLSMDFKCTFKNDCPIFSCALFINRTHFLNDLNEDSTVEGAVNGEKEKTEYNLYLTVTFWGFIILMCIGTVAFNVANCLSDAICFDVLGADRSMRYGWQRVWGTVGYGLTALLAGWAVDWASGGAERKDFTPAFLLALFFTVIDMYFCRKLELPKMSRPEGAGSALSSLLSRPPVLVFLFFAIVAGAFDSFIIYYMFWFLEELATETGQMANIKLLEGLTVAAESFGGELIFFAISGKILKKFGFGHTLTFCLICYGLRFFFISLITNPWQILAIELVMQGPTYALTYSTIVGYAAAVAPPGLSATLQGIVAGMDDGFGFAVGSLIGGLLYKYMGGRYTFQLFSAIAIVASAVHAILVATLFKNYVQGAKGDPEETNAGKDTPESGYLVQGDDETKMPMQEMIEIKNGSHRSNGDLNGLQRSDGDLNVKS